MKDNCIFHVLVVYFVDRVSDIMANFVSSCMNYFVIVLLFCTAVLWPRSVVTALV